MTKTYSLYQPKRKIIKFTPNSHLKKLIATISFLFLLCLCADSLIELSKAMDEQERLRVQLNNMEFRVEQMLNYHHQDAKTPKQITVNKNNSFNL